MNINMDLISLNPVLMNIIVVLLYIAAILILIKVSNFFIEKGMRHFIEARQDKEFEKQVITIRNLLKSAADTVIILLVFMYILTKFNVDIRPLLTAAGVVGVAVGFAARRFVEDVIMGVLIITEGQVRVGDYVKIDNFEGTVEKATLKMVILRDKEGNVHYIRNGMINIVSNMTRGKIK